MLLQLKDIYKSYPGNPVPVFNGLNLQVNQGELVAITGISGSGKSTLLNLIGTLDHDYEGQIKFKNTNINSLSHREKEQYRNEEIGFVFQNHHLLPQCTIWENILIPAMIHPDYQDSKKVENRAQQLLEIIGLSSRVSDYPNQLSIGECQRIAILRSLINHPALILADEPTGALDKANSQLIADLLIQLNQKKQIT
ncbi:MAG: ABC transporter ATP-binding protein, partial [Spirochaetes bacterium]|nr:ABC transporter ATP-binding protein [Spirochaetota bacterium]